MTIRLIVPAVLAATLSACQPAKTDAPATSTSRSDGFRDIRRRTIQRRHGSHDWRQA